MKFRNWQMVFLSTVLVILAAAFVACAPEEDPVDEADPDEEPVDEPQTGGTLVIGQAEEADVLHPHQTAAIASNFVMGQMGDALLTRCPDTGEIEPHLAEEYEVAEDGTEITFHLREDVQFHSGEPLDAHAYAKTFEAVDKDGHGQGAGRLGPLDEVIVEDDYTLTMTFDKPYGPLLLNLASSGYQHAMDPAHLDEYGHEDYGRNPSSTGPWKFEDWVSGESITLTRYEDYDWPEYFYENEGTAYPDEIELRYIEEDSTRMAALEAGELDVCSVSLADLDTFKDHPEFDLVQYDREGNCSNLWFNHDREPLDDVRVRRALAYGMNKEPIIQAAIEGHGEPAHGILPPVMWSYYEDIEDHAYTHQPDRAEELLDDAGWELPEGADVREKDGEELSLTLMVTPDEEVMRTSEMLQAQYRELGVDIEIDTYEWGTLMDYLSEGRHDLSIVGYSSTDPDWLYQIFHSEEAGVGMNWTFVRDEELDELLEGIRFTLDEEERRQYSEEAQIRAIENAHWAPIYRSDQYIAVHESVEDFDVNFRGTWLLHDGWLTE